MDVPNWGVWMMFIASAVGTWLLFMELKRKGWPSPI
jgi:hypothetical protein